MQINKGITMENKHIDSQNNVSKDWGRRDIFRFLSKPVRITISIALSITGLSIFSFIYVISDYEELVARLGMINLDMSRAMIILSVLMVLIFIGFFFIACVSLVALVRLKLIEQNIKIDASKKINELTDSVTCLKSEVNQLTLSKYILDAEQIIKLESSIASEGRIIVLTSKYHLDTGRLLGIILNNIKRGAIYQYVVPGEKINRKNAKILGRHHEDFVVTYTGWWNIFKEDLFRDEPGEIISSYHSEYQKLKKSALSLGSSNFDMIKENAKKYFSAHVQEFLVSVDYSLVTIIMYQKGSKTDHNFDIIMKLPTVSDGNYYAFKIPDEEKVEKKNLSDIIESFCRREFARLELN